ncbi:MAG: hypothetical protein GWN99_20505 [Gemmatimonadetes bacterium]|uniref:Uncharacterized protein n=1 Tax=Candidatus Kutchimonas denitrificans TaxID=3056748 RepID=A0AAE5CAL5_9BACT|nr:hypothetical protein [Gemmatimonadota bacterium]NIR76636.1 hypothetical protein [Candidatus Kutchimonas denitrificans]NIS03405.1 hypothetical protein [Gemmatimonadota bacterium]NIT69266.1 hypothetical protein [Gemmatimonadota bacterium]NIU54738.1 hypothetical protein [Gemmatimonadota bacterium]
MYSTCIYCNRRLGTNHEIESFPVGRRLAFDAEKGRLWAICEVCRRWNLTPLEERWEAIEECERRFSDTTRRFSTDNIGLARLGDGLELIRIGRPRRPEFAAWRYGREFLRRRIRSMIVTGTQVVVSVAGALLGADIWWFFIFGGKKQVVARPRLDDGSHLYVIKSDLKHVRLMPHSGGGWALRVLYRPTERRGLFGARGKGRREEVELTGPTAVRAAGLILPRVNSWGGTDSQVRSAVGLIEEVRDPERLFGHVAERHADMRGRGTVTRMDSEVRLALEMAAHEESERRALEGELAILEVAWREAEEIAAIADRLLIPQEIDRWIHKERKEPDG